MVVRESLKKNADTGESIKTHKIKIREQLYQITPI